mgnify:CR=1 FL=1
MRKRIFGRRLKRDKNARKALFRSLMSSLVLESKIKTTEAKAKAIKGEIEKLVTIAKKHGQEARGLLVARLASEKVAEKIIIEIAPKFESRPGGYIRILKLGHRVKDGAKMVLMTWVEEVSVTSFKEIKTNKNKPKKERPVKKTSAKGGSASGRKK